MVDLLRRTGIPIALGLVLIACASRSSTPTTPPGLASCATVGANELQVSATPAGAVTPPTPTLAPIRGTQERISAEEAEVRGMVVDFLAAALTNNEAKARAFLAPEYNAHVANLCQALGIQPAPEPHFSLSSSEVTDGHATVTVSLRSGDRSSTVKVSLEWSGEQWQITAVALVR